MLESIRVKNFRNIADQKIEFFRGINIICGGNGEGKTSLFEAMYMSLYLKSFTRTKDSYLVKKKENFFFIEAAFKNDFCKSVSFFSDVKEKIRTLKVDGTIFRKLSKYYGKNNIAILSVHDLDIISVSESKKGFINHISSLFNFEYVTLYSHYKQIINKKKILLEMAKRENGSKQNFFKILDSLNKALSSYCAEISQLKSEALTKFIKIFEKNLKLFFESIDIKIEYDKCVEKESWNKRFNEKREREIEQQTILEGVHKESFYIFFKEMDITKNSSDGQRKIATFLLKTSEADFIKEVKNINPILIFDDLNSTLDSANLDIFINSIQTFKDSQIFISFTDKKLIPEKLLKNEHKIIEVKNGEYR